MSIGRQADATLVKPLGKPGVDFRVRRKVAHEALEAGQGVYLNSDGEAALADGSAVATNYLLGIALQDVAAGETVDVLTDGPVDMATGATPGAIVYTSDTAGEWAESAGTKSTIVGVAESATTIFVRPQIVSLS